MAVLTPISKIKLPNGDIVPLSENLKVIIPEGSEYNVTWNISDFSGTVELITGATDEYRLNINEQPTT